MKEGGAAVIGLLTTVAGAVAVAAIASNASGSTALPSSPSSPSTSPCNTSPLASGWSWKTATNVYPGDRVRISMDASTFTTVTQSQGLATTGLQSWLSLLSSSAVQTAFGTSSICAWAPGQALPQDWPTDDPDDATEYHADFTYGGTVTLAVSAFPLPVSVWTAQTTTGNGNHQGAFGVGPGGSSGSGSSSSSNITPSQGQASGSIFKKPTTPSTNPQTVTLTGDGTQSVTSALPGTPLTIVLSGGGTFTSVSAYSTGPNASEVPTPGYSPMNPVPSLPWFTFTTPGATGTIAVDWTDSSGNTHATSINYGS